MKHLVITGFVAAAAVLAALVFSSRPEADASRASTPTAHASPNVDELSRQLAEMSQRYSAMEQQLRQMSVATHEPALQGSRGSSTPALAASTPAEPESQTERTERAILHINEIMENHFASTARDHAWASATETEIADFMAAGAYPGVDFDGAECRATMCRVELRFADEQALSRFLDAASRQHPWRYQAQMVPRSPDDMSSVNLYISRQGHSLPRI